MLSISRLFVQDYLFKEPKTSFLPSELEQNLLVMGVIRYTNIWPNLILIQPYIKKKQQQKVNKKRITFILSNSDVYDNVTDFEICVFHKKNMNLNISRIKH